jgi:cyclic dehypoxanthinyl futalosine synthase
LNPVSIYKKVLGLEPLAFEEGLLLYNIAPTSDLIYLANEIRQKIKPGKEVGWIIDRNVNITNVCFSQCKFCNFCRRRNDEDAYVTSIDEYIEKIDELFDLGGDQLLIQGGMNPELGLSFYTELFRNLKNIYPSLKLHALGPPEIVFLARKEGLPVSKILSLLQNAGLDSLPGAGAEVLSDRVRKIVSPGKATVKEWLDVMKEAHLINLPTSATMMFGHIETKEEIIDHLILIRDLQEQKPDDSYGFITFIPWPFQYKGTLLSESHGIVSSVTALDYIRTLAISRIMLHNFENVQTSILTVGRDTAMITLHGGANDLGSVMIEENVVSAAGGGNRFDSESMKSIIRDAGFIPRRRNQKYEPLPD